MVPGTLAYLLPHRNNIRQTQEMTPHPVTVYKHSADLLMWNTQLPIVMSWVRPDQEILPCLRPSTHTSEGDAIMVVVTQRHGRKCTVPNEYSTHDLWCANPLRYPLTHSCFFSDLYIELHRSNQVAVLYI